MQRAIHAAAVRNQTGWFPLASVIGPPEGESGVRPHESTSARRAAHRLAELGEIRIAYGRGSGGARRQMFIQRRYLPLSEGGAGLNKEALVALVISEVASELENYLRRNWRCLWYEVVVQVRNRQPPQWASATLVPIISKFSPTEERTGAVAWEHPARLWRYPSGEERFYPQVEKAVQYAKELAYRSEWVRVSDGLAISPSWQTTVSRSLLGRAPHSPVGPATLYDGLHSNMFREIGPAWFLGETSHAWNAQSRKHFELEMYRGRRPLTRHQWSHRRLSITENSTFYVAHKTTKWVLDL